MLDSGRIVADETPEALISRFGRHNLEEVFLDIARRTQPRLIAERLFGDGD
jgi:ABC-type Na+ transport system ATPase subunit NatA